jgi:hypothetical protein
MPGASVASPEVKLLQQRLEEAEARAKRAEVIVCIAMTVCINVDNPIYFAVNVKDGRKDSGQGNACHPKKQAGMQSAHVGEWFEEIYHFKHALTSCLS